MRYDIVATPANARRTPQQRLNPYYSEAPVLGSTILRRGKVLSVSESGFRHLYLPLKRFIQAGAVEVWKVHSDGTKERIELPLVDAPPVETVVEPVVATVEVAAAPEEVIPEEVQPQEEAATVDDAPKFKKRRKE